MRGLYSGMTEHSKTVRLKIAKWYAKNLLKIEPGFNVHLAFDKKVPEQNECTATFTCFDDYPYFPYRKTKEDLEEYIVRRFGSMILEDRKRSRLLDLSPASKGVPLKHPIARLDKKDYPSFSDNYKEEYILDLTKEQLLEANGTLGRARLKVDKVKPTSSYESDIYKLRIGKWQ